jgi:MFS family permease
MFPAILQRTAGGVGLLVWITAALAGMAGAISTSVLLFGMILHLFDSEGFSASSRWGWIALFILFFPIGELVFYFRVYSRDGVAPDSIAKTDIA